MAEAPTAAMTAILTLIIIGVVVLLMYTLAPDTFAQITGIADEVFNAEKYEAEEIETLIEAAYTQFFTDIDDCEEVREEKEQSSCYCKSTTLKDLPEGSYFNFENEYSTSLTVTALTDEGVPIEQDKKEYVLGLFAIVEEGNKKALGCLYPDNYFVFAKDEGGGTWANRPGWLGGSDSYEANNWYIQWKDKRTDKWFYASGADYTFSFYADKGQGTGYSNYLYYAPIFYHVADNRYCLLTDLIEFPIDETVTDLNFESLLEISNTAVRVDEGSSVTVTNYEQVGNFFTADDVVYCTDDR